MREHVTPLTLSLPCGAFQGSQWMNQCKALATCSHFVLGVNLGHLFCARGVLSDDE